MKANSIPLYKKKDKHGFFEARFTTRHQHKLSIKEECGIFGISENEDAADHLNYHQKQRISGIFSHLVLYVTDQVSA